MAFEVIFSIAIISRISVYKGWAGGRGVGWEVGSQRQGKETIQTHAAVLCHQ